MPKYFPNYEKYLWIDCDAWVNNWECIDLYFKACDNGKLGITQTIGPGYKITSKVNWLFGKLAIIKSQNFKHAVKSNIGYDKARKLAFAPHINIGVFSLQKNSKAWNSWQNNLSKTLKSGNIFGSEGLAINISVYIDNLETEFLPLNCNWIASNLLPKYDLQQKANQAKKTQKTVSLKEIKLRPGTEAHDYNFKIKNAKKFITKGDKVKFTVKFKGREMQPTVLGKDLMNKIIDETKDVAKVESKPKFEGRQMVMIIQPL